MSWSRLWTSVLDLCFPPTCAGCRAPRDVGDGMGLCLDCRQGMSWIGTNSCAQCGRPAELCLEGSRDPWALASREHSTGPPTVSDASLVEGWPAPIRRAWLRCASCLQTPPPFTRAVSLYAYSGAVRDLIHRCKYRDDRPARWMMCALFREGLTAIDWAWESYDWILPIPLHPKRLRARGFNQAWALIQKSDVFPTKGCAPFVLQQRYETPSQVGLGREARHANAGQRFVVAHRWRPRVKGATLLLIDDVLTTGATVTHASACLLEAGAARVDVLTLARAIL